MKLFQKSMLAVVMAAALSMPIVAQTPAAAPAATAKKTVAPAPVPPTDAEISDAKAKGLVWVNTSTKKYHKDDADYGKTKRGKFMAEADAQKAGYVMAKPSPVAKKAAVKTTTPKMQ
jgi:hypothetical protein